MAFRSRIARPTGRGAKLRKTWCRAFTTSGIELTVTQQEVVNCGITEGSALDATVLRSRGWAFLVAVPNAADDEEVIGLGLVVVNEAAQGVGGASLPGPIADINSDAWLWHALIPMDGSTLTAADPQAIGTNRYVEIDSKAMRRVAADQTVVLVGERSQSSFASVSVLAGMSTLFGT